MKTPRKILCFSMVFMILISLFSGCQRDPAPPVSKIDPFAEAVFLGIAWEELTIRRKEPILSSELLQLFQNALRLLDKTDADIPLQLYARKHNENETVQRYKLAELLYLTRNMVISDHNFTLSAAVIHYEVGGIYREFSIWDCPDLELIESLCDPTACNYAVCGYDRITGDKLMELYEDWTFRPTEVVTVESAVETVYHFARSFENDPIYTDVTDDLASQHTIDPELYTGPTTLPDATNQDLPDWRGCNISYCSMFAGALCMCPDDIFVESNLDYIKDLGLNYVHLYLTWSYFQGPDHTFDNKVNLSRLEQLDEIISWCMERDIHIQLVFNDVPNLDYNNQDINEWFEACGTVFTDIETRNNVITFWRMLAKRYADIPNNYLSFNLMNECNPINEGRYEWALGAAALAIWEESPGRVVVADIHSPNPGVTGERMAALGCALSFHFYSIPDISIVTPEKEASAPGFYESVTGPFCFANASIFGPSYWDKFLPEEAKGALSITGAVGGATLSVTIQDISSFDTVMRISADGQTLYEGMKPYTYDAETDCIGVNRTVTVTIPENATGFEISCPVGSCINLSDISLTLANGTQIPFMLIFDYWRGTTLAEITVTEDGNFTSTLTLEKLVMNGRTLEELIAIGEKYGVDVMIGECGFFEGGGIMETGMNQDAVEDLFAEQIETFERLGLAWCFEYIGRYTLVTPAPYLERIEYLDLENSPYYVNLEMDAFFREILSQ